MFETRSTWNGWSNCGVIVKPPVRSGSPKGFINITGHNRFPRNVEHRIQNQEREHGRRRRRYSPSPKKLRSNTVLRVRALENVPTGPHSSQLCPSDCFSLQYSKFDANNRTLLSASD